MAIALSVLDVIEDENLQENASEVGKYALKELKTLMQKHEIIGDVRYDSKSYLSGFNNLFYFFIGAWDYFSVWNL